MLFRFAFSFVCSWAFLTSAEYSCNEGWTKCLSRDECYPKDCDIENVTDVDMEARPTCGPGQVYCLATEACVPVCPNLGFDEQVEEQCSGELIFCLSLGRCVPPNNCADGKSVGDKKCPSGTQFCLSAGACLQSHECGPSVGELSCPFGQVYCFETKQCERNCFDSKNFSSEKEGASMMTSQDEGANETFSDDTQEKNCQHGMIFCTKFQRCLPKSFCDAELSSGDRWLQSYNVTCPHGMIFCLAKGECTDIRLCQNVSISDINHRRCQPPNIFCMSYGRCVHPSHCSQMETRRSCPSGFIFCMDRGRCTRNSECNTVRSGSITCEKGTVFCANLGVCSRDCSTDLGMFEFSEALCPHMAGEFKYTNCVSSEHCPPNHICCTDSKTLHLQCINPLRERRQTRRNILESSCSALNAGKEDTSTGVECNRPEDCMAGSLCCDNVCQTPRGTKSCPLRTFFSSIKSRCERVGSDSIHSCSPFEVFCPSDDGCVKYSECEFASDYEIAWMMPQIVYIEKEGQSVETDGIPFTSLYDGGSEEAEFKVEGVPGDPFAFEYREGGQETLRWKHVTPTTLLKTTFYIRFTITNTKYEFALPYLNLTEKESNISRYISQVVAIKSSKLDLNVRNPLLVSLEDQVQLVAFHEVFSIGEASLESYWTAWEKAIGMPTKYLEMGLLDPSKPTTVELVEILTSPDQEIQGFLNIKYIQPEDSNYKATLKLEVSLNEGRSWKLLKSPGMSLNLTIESTEEISDILLKFTPLSNRWGNASFRFNYIDISSSSPEENNDDSNVLTIQVLKLNDAPKAMMLEDLTQIPVLTPQNPEIVISANKLASLFYVDRDEDALGVAVIYAQISVYGSWMYSVDDGKTWTEISDLNEFPLSEGAANPYRRTTSKSSNLQANPEGSPESYESKAKSQSIYSVFQSNINVSTSTDKVNALFFSTSVLIKYKVKVTTPWDVITAINSTRLLITAWDGTDSESKDGALTFRKEISLSKCTECGGFGSLAFSPTLVVAQWSGCNGETIITESNTVLIDECGICGGDGSTCKDCKGVVNGTAMEICGKCVDGEEDDPRDCAGECNNANSIETVDGNEICLLKGDNILVCDKPCVKCIDNSTNTIDKEGLDECGVCEGINSCQGCDDQEWSSKVTDICGNCLEPSSNEFNEGCKGIGYFLPSVIDVAVIESLTLPETSETSKDIQVTPGIESITVSGKVTGKLEVKDCSFIREESTQVKEALSLMQSSKNLRIIPPKLEEGMWNIQCGFKSSSQSITSNEKIAVVDSSSVEIQSLSDSEVDLNMDSEITLTLTNAVDLSNSFCFLKYSQSKSDTDYYELLPATDLPEEDNLLMCHLNPSLRPGKAEIGVVLKASTLNFLERKELTLKTQQLLLNGLTPRVKEASFDGVNKLSIKFNVNIEILNNCLENFKSASSIFGEGATCMVKLNIIEITLGENFNLEEEVVLSDTNQIIQKYGDPESSPKAEGPIVMTNATTKSSIDFELRGPSKICNGSNVRVTVTLKDDLDPAKFQMSWNITWQNKYDEKSQREVLLIWNSTRDIQNIFDNEKSFGTIEFPGILLRPGVVYLIVGTLEGPNNFVSDPRSFTVESISFEENLLISIRGKQKIYPQKTYVYSAEIEMCTNNQLPNSKYMFFWSLDNAESKFESLYLKHRILKPWSLRGGEKRTINVAVASSDQSFIGYGTMDIEAVKQGIEAKVFPEGLKTGTANSFMLDASQSRSLDDPNAKLYFTWTCRRADGGGCYVIENKKPKRFENAISTEDLNKPALKIPPLLLLQDRYVMKVTVRDMHGDSSTAMANVEVVSGYLPHISVNMTSELVDITQPIYIEGWISSHSNAEIQWKSVDEEGFGRVEISPAVSDAFMISAVRGPVENFPVSLTIPTTTKWENISMSSGMNTNSHFKFRLSAFTAGQEDSYADIVITKKSPPIPGKIEVNPEQGEGLTTSFSFSTTSWKDNPMDLPFTASFGYVFSSAEEVDFSRAVWFGKAYGDELSSTTYLPSVSNDQTKILPVVRVCDNTMACTDLKGEKPVTVTPPTEISMEKIQELGSILESKMVDNNLVEGAIREATEIMKTLKAMGDMKKINSMMEIIEYQMKRKSQKLKASLTRNAEAASASLGMLYSSTSLNDVHFLQRENYDQLGSLRDHFLAYIRNEAAPEEEEKDFVYPQIDPKSEAPKDPVYYPNTDEDLDAARKSNSSRGSIDVNVGDGNILNANVGGDEVLKADVGGGDVLSASVGGDEVLKTDVGGGDLLSASASVGGDKLLNVNAGVGNLLNINLGIGKRRRKRQSELPEGVKPLTAEEVFRLVNFTEMQIKNSTDEEKVNHMNQLVQDISTYISSLCLNLQTSDEAAVVYGQNVSIRVLKPRLEGKDMTNFIVADPNGTDGDFVVKSRHLTWGPVLNSYTEWDCGKMDADGNKVNCFGACLATVEYGDMYNGPVDDSSLPGVSSGHMIRAALLNPEKGTEIALKDLSTKMAFNISAESVKPQELETSKETNLQCFGWTDNKWSQKACMNNERKAQEIPNYIVCECNQTTYVKIFAVEKEQEPVTESPEVPTEPKAVVDPSDETEIKTEATDETIQTETTEQEEQTEMVWMETKRYIKAKFDGNYTEVVGLNNEREEEAKRWMTEEIARRINISSSRMREVNITEGSVDYEAYIVDDESVMRTSNENSADEASAVLAKLISENFVIEGPNGERLTAISDPPGAKEKESFLPILIGGIVGGVLLICFVFVILAIYYHTKKKQDKVTALDGNLPPSYREIQFDKSFDGNDPSGLKRRSGASRGSKRGMTPDSANYINEDGKDGLIIERSIKSRSGSHTDSGFGNDEDVPDAFQYKTPTKEQLDRTGPIPEHVLRQVNSRGQDIPGTPQES